MTTTAHEDQFGEATEKHLAMYSIEEILRRNVADLELELQRQRERAEAAEAVYKENERLKELMAKRTREHQQEMTSFRLRVRSQDDATFAALREENERLRENARRYLALRELFKTEWLCNYLDYGPGKELESSSARLQLDIPSTTAAMGSPPTSLVDGNIVDAAADRLLEEAENANPL